MTSASDPLSRLPDELLEAIVIYLPPADTLCFGATCRRCNKVTYEPLVWRRHCLQGWKYWEPRHEIKEKIKLPPAQVKWRRLYEERRETDEHAYGIFEDLLETQQHRMKRMEKVAKFGYDVKDLLLRQKNETPDDAYDVLARRYHAAGILGQIHRKTALEKWNRLQLKQMVKLEEVLGAYDLFVLSGREGDLEDMNCEFDRIAERIRATDPEFDDFSIRQKAIQVAKFLASEGLVGNPSEDDYHALRNNFISMALFETPHSSLPLQSVAIYCAVARRLGVNAKPSNYPHHVHAVIEAPAEVDLNGKARTPGEDIRPEDPAHIMHMDPWRSSSEVPRSSLAARLIQMGAPVHQHNHHLAPTSTIEVALRTGRNIMNSVQEARDLDRQRGTNRRPHIPDIESAWYSMLWAMLVLGDGTQSRIHRMRQVLPYLIEHYQAHFPEDLNLIEEIVAPMFEREREQQVLMHLITTSRAADENMRAPSRRPTDGHGNLIGVAYTIGTHFQHKRYGYEGVIVGWDDRCGAEQRWIEQMRVDELPRGRDQPFYNVVSVFSPSQNTASRSG